MWIKLLTESTIPSDIEVIRNAYHHSSDEMFVPTREFMKAAFKALNKDLFDGDMLDMCESLDFIPKTLTGGRYGAANALFNRVTGEMTPTDITLNSARKMSLHNWLEIMAHEMLHIYDYCFHQEHYAIRGYDCHGKWFMSHAQKFSQLGFHLQATGDLPYEMDATDKTVAKRVNDTIFLSIWHIKYYKQKPIICIAKKDMQKTIDAIKAQLGRSAIITPMTSKNPNIADLSKLRLRDSHSRIKWYFMNDDFIKEFGPFEEGRIILNEDKDEEPFDTHHHIEDDYARHLYDIKGVIDVEKIDDENYKVTIS